jgi:hypothetical protein
MVRLYGGRFWKRHEFFDDTISMILFRQFWHVTPGFIETTNLKLLFFFLNNTCFTFNSKFAISLRIIRILALGFLKITPVLH